MICTGSSNCGQNWAARLGWRLTTVCTASRSRWGSSGPVTVMSSCTAYTSSPEPWVVAGVEEQSLLQGGQRQDVGDPVVLRQLVDLVLAQPGGGDVGRGQPAAAVLDVSADAGQRVKPQLAESADLVVVEDRGRPGPGGVQVRAGVGVDGDGVEFHGVHQWHGHRCGGTGDRHAVLADPPQPIGEVGGGAEASKVVESDGGVGPGQLNLEVQIAQQSVGQAVGQGAKLFFGVFDDRAECGFASDHLRPAQSTHCKRHRVFGGEPAHGAGQIDVGGQVVVAAVAFDVDADRRAAGAQEFGARPARRRSARCRGFRRETPRAPRRAAGGWCRYRG